MKKRLDQILLDQGLVDTRQKAQALIMRGLVLVNEEPELKPGTKLNQNTGIRIKGEFSNYVGRGGDKLEFALDTFGVDVTGRIVIDIGSSTGGFTDCLLQRGASEVYAVDVGTNQLADKLRRDDRVHVMENLHVRDLASREFVNKPQFAVVDLSFISLRKVLKHIVQVMQEPFEIVALVKPQFELEPGLVDKGGVVNDRKLQLQAVELVKAEATNLGLELVSEVASKLKGAKKGNQEYFVYLKKSF